MVAWRGAEARVEVREECGLAAKQKASSSRRGVFARRSFDVGDVVFEDAPVLSMQDVDRDDDGNPLEGQRVWACARCQRFVGSVEAHVARNTNAHSQALDALRDNPEAAALNAGAALHPARCVAGCGEAYCSPACRDWAWRHHHFALCPAAAASSHPSRAAALDAFLSHARATNGAFLLAAQCVCLLSIADAHPDPSDPSAEGTAEDTRIMADALRFAHRPLWWECVPCPRDVLASAASAEEGARDFAADLRACVQDSFALFVKATAGCLPIPSHPPTHTKGSKGSKAAPAPSPCDLALFASFVGMFEQNNLGICLELLPPSLSLSLLCLGDGQGGEEEGAISSS